MKISVLGIGYVGTVSAACLAAQGHTVVAVDNNERKVAALNAGRSPIVEPGLPDLIRDGVAAGRLRATSDLAAAVAESQLSIVCVGTPSLPTGNLDLSDVVRVCESLARAIRDKDDPHYVVIRSTVLPGSTRDVIIPTLERFSGKKAADGFGVAFYPEFMRESSAVADYRRPGTIVFGVEDDATEMHLRELIEGIEGELFITDYGTAEAIKYANNAWHATKIVFANEIGNFCKSQDIDGRKVMQIMCADRRLNISPAYLRPGFAYGGSCLPKDLRALRYRAKSCDLALPLMEALPASNARQIARAVAMVEAAGHRRVGLVGLSFKGGTDDLRESPTVELVETLHGKGYELRIFDHNVTVARLIGSNLRFVEAHLPRLEQWLTTDLSELAAFAETLVVVNGDLGGATLPRLRDGQVLIDLIGLEDAKRPSGGIYQGLCW
ncbi:MAG TPA: UDP-glucose/GDP-mannose dehydrogenase family protein [Stellaceae bacterium]|nr:UDP-glucose/GDP-mannose dehydrogenase family protein [Stellaceae bacterium]